jgi:OCT family organic cation transporter-like MFS transporter 18
VFPYLSSQLGASPTQIGLLNSASQLFQLVGAPFMGRLMDKRGPKVALLLSHAFAALSYLLLSLSASIPTLYLSQLPTFFLAAMHGSSVYLTILSTPAERAAALGSLSLSYGIGMVIGPTVGGICSAWWSYQTVAFAASIASLAVLAVVWLLLPDIVASPASAAATTPASPTSLSAAVGAAAPASSEQVEAASPAVGGSLSALTSLLSVPVLRHLLLFKLLCNFAVSIYRSAYTLLLKDAYGLTPEHSGFVLSGVGLLLIATNTLLVAPITAAYRTSSIITASLLVLTLTFLSLPFTTTLPTLLATIVPITVSAAIAATILSSALTTSASLSSAGAVLGVDHSVSTLARTVAPPVAGLLLEAGQTQLGLACGLVAGAAWAVSNWTVWPDDETKAAAGKKTVDEQPADGLKSEAATERKKGK